MKPFHLEAAKAGEPIVCRDGTPAKFIAHVPSARKKENLVVLIGDEIVLFTDSGKFYPDGTEESFDLFMAPKKRTVWVNFYKTNWASFHDSEHIANQHATASGTMNRLGNRAYPVEIEE